MKENREIEKLIRDFVYNSTGLLKRDSSLDEDTRKAEMEKHVVIFINILRECLGTLSHVPGLEEHLNTIAEKLSGSDIITPLESTVAELFQVSDLQTEINNIQKFCTQKVDLPCSSCVDHADRPITQ